MDQSSYALDSGTIDLAMVWRGLRAGELYVGSSHCASGRCWATLEVGSRAVIASPTALDVLERVLNGEPQKVLAYELGRCVPTIAGYCSQALRAICCEHNCARAPILLVMAATAARGVRVPKAKLERLLDDGSWLVSVVMPGDDLARQLSPGEWEVARAAIEGKSHAQIARARGTSPRTIANQLASIFGKTGIYGCPALRAKAATIRGESERDPKAGV
jgi:DNA-binding NarL/FixJ family response regulator